MTPMVRNKIEWVGGGSWNYQYFVFVYLRSSTEKTKTVACSLAFCVDLFERSHFLP